MSSVMRRVSVRNLVAHKVRLLLTLTSVVLGTAFVAGHPLKRGPGARQVEPILLSGSGSSTLTMPPSIKASRRNSSTPWTRYFA